MTFTQLEILLTLHEMGSFTLTALRLNISQPAVSQAINALERTLDAKLVNRGKTTQNLTEVGLRLLPHFRVIIGQENIIRQEALSSKSLASGKIRIGSMGANVSLHLLPDLLKPFSERYPGIDMYVAEAHTDTIKQWVFDQHVDLGFISTPVEDNLEYMTLANDEFVVLLSETNPLAQKSEIHISDLDGQPFIFNAAGAGNNPNIQTLLASHKVKPKIIFYLSQVISILGVVQSGLAITIIGKLGLPQYPGVTFRPLCPHVSREIVLVARSSKELNIAAQKFWLSCSEASVVNI